MHWLAAETAPGAAAVSAALNAFWTSWSNSAAGGYSATLEPEIDIVNPSTGLATGTLGATTFTKTGVGSASNALPQTTQMLIRWRTGVFVNGRELRGRTFLPGFTEANNDSGAPDSAILVTVATWAVTLATASGADLAVYSRQHGNAATISTSSVWGKWAVLRSRRD